MLKKDEIIVFAKLNIKQDLQDLQVVFENSLIKTKENLITQRKLEKIKNTASSNELILNTKKEIANNESEFDMEFYR